MRSRFLQFLVALLCVTLTPGVRAQGHSGGHGNHGGGVSHDRDDDRDRHADRDHDRDDNHDRDSHSDKNVNRPAGWDKGKKKGWGDCDVPPGQVKKLGCHPNSAHHVAHHDRDHDRDRDHHVSNRDRDRDRDRHTSTVKPATTTTTTVKKTTTTNVPTQTREQARRTGGKVFNDDGTWHYANQPATPTTTKK